MGIDFLDIVSRLEKEFSLGHRSLLFGERHPAHPGVTAGEVHGQVCRELREIGREVPPDSRPRVQSCIGKALGVPPDDIRPEDQLVADLGAE